MSCLPVNISALIHAKTVETSRLEFKSTWDVPTKYQVLRTICAFANDLQNLNGGYIILGVRTDDQGRPVLPPDGLSGLDLDRVQREIRGLCRRIVPEYQPVMSPELLMGKTLLAIWAPGGDNRPYQAPEGERGPSKWYVRVGSQTVAATGELLVQLYERTARVPFDDRRNQSARIEDISSSLVRRFLADIGSDLVSAESHLSDSDLYRCLQIVSQVNAHEVPRNVALLFFSENPEKYFPGARIEVVQFADDAGGNLIEERVFRGPLPQQIRLALDYLNSMGDTLLRKEPGQADVTRTVAYPYEAMEEAVVNAVFHRSYENEREPTKVYLYPDRMEIISYPGPVPGLSPADFNSGRPVPPVPARNRRIGEFLKELRLAEARGTGIPKIRRKMAENGSPEPRFDFDEARSYFRVTLPAHPRYVVLHALRESSHLWAVGERTDAISHLLRAYEQRPGSGALAGQIIQYASLSGNVDLARRVFERFRGEVQRTEDALPYLRYAAALLDNGMNEEALAVLTETPLTSQPDDVLENALLRKRARDYREAHRLFKQVYAARMDDPKVVHEFAQTKMRLASEAYRKRDKVTSNQLNREAAELLRRALQLATDPVREAWCWVDLAAVLHRLGAPATEIESAYLRALALRPDEERFKHQYEAWKEGRGRRSEPHRDSG